MVICSQDKQADKEIAKAERGDKMKYKASYKTQYTHRLIEKEFSTEREAKEFLYNNAFSGDGIYDSKVEPIIQPTSTK